jgi:hypothetical protein
MPQRLFYVPVPILKGVAKILGKKSVADRLLGSLQVDVSDLKSDIGWTPMLNMDESLGKMFDA